MPYAACACEVDKMQFVWMADFVACTTTSEISFTSLVPHRKLKYFADNLWERTIEANGAHKNASFCSRNSRAGRKNSIMQTWAEKILFITWSCHGCFLHRTRRKMQYLIVALNMYALTTATIRAHIFTYTICEWLLHCHEWMCKLHTMPRLAFTKLWRAGGLVCCVSRHDRNARSNASLKQPVQKPGIDKKPLICYKSVTADVLNNLRIKKQKNIAYIHCYQSWLHRPTNNFG